jgi:hypothetical protein
LFIEQGNERSRMKFNQFDELLNHQIDGQKIFDIATEIQPFFRCF